MRIDFDNQSFIEISVSNFDDKKVSIILSAKDGNNSKNTIVNSAEISMEDFKKIALSILKV